MVYSNCGKHFPLLSSFMTYHRVCNKSNTTGATGFQWGSCYSIFSFMCNVLQIVVCPFVLFLLAIVLSVLLQFTDFDYPFGIFNIFFLSVLLQFMEGARVTQCVRSLDLTTHTSLSSIPHGFAPGFVNYKKGCTRLAATSDKVYQLLAHGRWFSPGYPPPLKLVAMIQLKYC